MSFSKKFILNSDMWKNVFIHTSEEIQQNIIGMIFCFSGERSDE